MRASNSIAQPPPISLMVKMRGRRTSAIAINMSNATTRAALERRPKLAPGGFDLLRVGAAVGARHARVARRDAGHVAERRPTQPRAGEGLADLLERARDQVGKVAGAREPAVVGGGVHLD